MPTKIFVANLDDHSKSEDLREMFEQYGKVTECDILKNYGFVHMEKEDEAKTAISNLNGSMFDGKKIDVELSHNKSRGGRGGGRGGWGRGGGGGGRYSVPTKIFVGNLSDSAKSDDLRVLFEKYGRVTECDVLRNFGFVHMENSDDAQDAINGLNGCMFEGLKMSVELSHSKPRDYDNGGGPMRGFPRGGPRGRGGPFRGRGGGRGDPYSRPPFESQYDSYMPPPPLPPPGAMDRRPPVPRDARRFNRDPYSRPPPDYYVRSKESSLERLYELRRQYEEEYYNFLYGPRDQSPPRFKDDGFRGGPGGPMGEPRPDPSRGYGYGGPGSSGKVGNPPDKYSNITSAMLSLAQKIKDSKGFNAPATRSSDAYDPYDPTPKERERLYNAYEMS